MHVYSKGQRNGHSQHTFEFIPRSTRDVVFWTRVSVSEVNNNKMEDESKRKITTLITTHVNTFNLLFACNRVLYYTIAVDIITTMAGKY